MTRKNSWLGAVAVAMLYLATVSRAHAQTAWLDGDPNAIWQRPPGFYQEGGQWLAILHTRPSVTRVQIVGDFTNGTAQAIDLTKTPDGKFWWFKSGSSVFARAPQAGDCYRFRLTHQDGTDQTIQDPAARWVEHSGLNACSRVTDSGRYVWGDSAWRRPGWDYYMIYELHPSRFSNRGPANRTPFQRITEELNGNGQNDHIPRMKATALELMPVSEFPTDRSWGYNPSFFYAIETAYGTPDQLKELVDTAHRQGIAVIMDVEINHGGTGDNILWVVAQDTHRQGTYYDGDTEWGALVNFDNDITKHFFGHLLKYLASEYHIDAFRFDFTRAIHDENHPKITIKGSGGGWEFLCEMRRQVKSVDPSILLIAEELPNDWGLTVESANFGCAPDRHGHFDAQWTDNFHDRFKEVLFGDSLGRLDQVFTNFGDSWHDGVIYTESHDEVGNEDKRVARHARDGKGWETDQIAGAGTVLARGIPMLFMGQECGDHRQFGEKDDTAPSWTLPTWWDDFMLLNECEIDASRVKVRLWWERMMEIRRDNLRAFSAGDINVTHLDEGNGVVAFTRDNGKYLVVLNFKGNSWDRYNVGVQGRYQELANTSWPSFNIGGYQQRTRGGDTAHQITEVPVPSYGAVVLVRWDP
jgi:1,4-alpha-glucan branching enzyme